jgi:predicted ATPase
MINEINLHNFKCYKNQKFILSGLTVFCGSNSVGKSTVIQALSIPLQSYFGDEVALNGNLTEIGLIGDLHTKSPDGEELFLELKINDSVKRWGYEDQQDQKVKNKSGLSLISKKSHGTAEPFQQLLLNFQFLQAERLGPRNNFDVTESNRFHIDWLGAKGEFTAELLSRQDSTSRLFVGGVLQAIESDSDPRLHFSESKPSLLRQIDAWMKEISPGISVISKLVEEASVAVNVFSQNKNELLKPHNVGFGVSYALSIVTALLHTKKGGLVIIENPEAHLHPKGQSYLGRLIALTAIAGVQVIIETHSDHLLNGIRVIARLREDYESGSAKVFFVHAGDDSSGVEEIIIGNKGELSSWPEGFFDQQAIDIKTLMRGRES